MTNAITDSNSKVGPSHLDRKAYVYVRQSSPQQVFHHAESRRRQYEMAEWVQQIGWPEERIIVIDEDQGKTAAVAGARSGFERLAKAVGRGEAGIVVSLEVSRLARNSPDWYHLLYLSRWTDTLISDGQIIYDPKLSADRMILGTHRRGAAHYRGEALRHSNHLERRSDNGAGSAPAWFRYRPHNLTRRHRARASTRRRVR